MNKIKFVEVSPSTRIIDGLSKLIIFREYNPQIPEGEWVPCGFKEFTTKKGRNAVEVDFGGRGHLCRFYHGGGDKNWEGWTSRKAANAAFADAAPASNGGGCWWEVQIIKEGITPIPQEVSSYLDEIDEIS